jgi:hypothetical protein
MQSRAFIRLQAADSKARPHEWENMAEEKTGGLTADRKTPGQQQATRAELQARLEQQIAIARRASSLPPTPRPDAEPWRWEKIQAEEKIQGLEQEVGLFKAELETPSLFSNSMPPKRSNKALPHRRAPLPRNRAALLRIPDQGYSDGRGIWEK